MFFETLSPAPPDPILGLTEAFKKDDRPNKVNLGVGVYVDDAGRTPVLACVKEAERRWWSSEQSKGYLPIPGAPEYGRWVRELQIGPELVDRIGERLRTAHTPGGTGALRVGAELLKKIKPKAAVWLSDPTWANHKGIFSAAGFTIESYPYYDPATGGVRFDDMAAALRAAGPDDVVLLHVCCHNPTGADLTLEQWREVAAIAADRRWLPFFDFAYQGFGRGIEEDRAGLRPMLEAGVDGLIAGSFSKNFGLYNERVGALTLAATTPEAADAAFSHLKATVRTLYSNPASHGGAIVMEILRDNALRAQWLEELAAMRERIAATRCAVVSGMRARTDAMDFSFIEQQYGMFSFSGLSPEQVRWLREERAIYVVGSGRINVAGLTAANLDRVCDALAEALKRA